MADISLERENREGPSKIDLNNPEIQDMISLDLHANNYRDGVWGSLRHCVVKDGSHLLIPLIYKSSFIKLLCKQFYMVKLFASSKKIFVFYIFTVINVKCRFLSYNIFYPIA